jgi:hypothetical protein
MNWKKIALWAVVVVLVLRFAPQIRAALSGVPLVNKVIG